MSEIKTIFGGRVVIFTLTLLLMMLSISPFMLGVEETMDTSEDVRVSNEISGNPPGWSDDIQLTFIPELGSNQRPTISVNGDVVHIVWENNTDGHIGYTRSEDAGRTWADPMTITTGNVAWSPRIAVNDSNVHLVYEKNNGASWEVVYQNSTDDGETWNAPTFLTISDGIDSKLPDIAVDGDNIHVVWEDEGLSAPGSYEIIYCNSTDGGSTWNVPIQLTNYPGGSDTMPKIAANNSIVHVYWDRYVTGTGTFEAFYRRSLDNGSTWESEKLISLLGSGHSANGDLAVYGSNVYVIWMDSRNGAWETYINISNDNGVSWNGEMPLTDIDGRNSFGAAIGVWNETIYVVWGDPRDDYPYPEAHEAYMNYSSDGGISWHNENVRIQFALNNSGPGDIALTESYVHLILVDNRTGKQEIYYKRYPDFPPDPEYNISLSQGWNLISLPLEQSDDSIDQVLQSINGKWDLIQWYDPLDTSDHWKSNATYKPDQLNELKTLDHRMGFWIYMNESANLTVSGPIPSSTTIDLYAGWNLVGYPTLCETMDVGDAFFGTGANRVEVFNASAPYDIMEVGPGYIMKPGEGYWVHVPVDTVWTVDW